MGLTYNQEREFGFATLFDFVSEVAGYLDGWTVSQPYEHSVVLSYGKADIFCRLAQDSKEDNIKITYRSNSAITEGHKTTNIWGYDDNEGLFETTQTTNKTPEQVAKALRKKIVPFLSAWRTRHGKHLENQDYYGRKRSLASRLGNEIGANPHPDKDRAGKYQFGITDYVEFRAQTDTKVEMTISGLSEDKAKQILELLK